MAEVIILNHITKEELADIKNSFSDGKHFKIKSIKKNKTLISKKEEEKIVLCEEITEDTTQSKYKIKERGIEKIIYITNFNIYKYYEEYGEYPKGLICLRCRQSVKNVWVIPIKKTVVNKKNIYHGYGVYHDNSCAYAEFKKNFRNNPVFSSSERLIKEINLKLLGTSDISEAKEIDLLSINNGPLSLEEYNNDSIKFEQVGIIYAPIEIVYKGHEND